LVTVDAGWCRFGCRDLDKLAAPLGNADRLLIFSPACDNGAKSEGKAEEDCECRSFHWILMFLILVSAAGRIPARQVKHPSRHKPFLNLKLFLASEFWPPLPGIV